MEYFRLLRQKRLAILWLSQVLSAIGDQLYLIAAMWLAVEVSPGAAATVAMVDFAAGLVFFLVGGVLADRLNKRFTMILVDLIRAIAVLTLPVMAHYGSITLAHLIIVGATIGGLGALFDPCLVASLSTLTTDNPQSLKAMTALIDMTSRLARAIGPGLAGALAACIPLSHFFSLDACTFFISTAAVMCLGKSFAWSSIKNESLLKGLPGIAEEIREAVLIVSKHSLLAWDFITFFVINIVYSIAFTVGMPVCRTVMVNL